MKIKGFYRKPINNNIDPKNIAEGLLSVPQILKEIQSTQNDIVIVVDRELKKIDDKLSEIDKVSNQSVSKIDAKVAEFENTAIGLIKDIKSLPNIKGDPGLNADHEAIVKDVLSKIPAPQVIDENSIIQRVTAKIPVSKASLKIIQEKFETDPLSVLDKILALPEDKFKLKTSQIDGLDQTIRALQHQLGTGRGYLHGGGDTVIAGTNVTITTNSAGQKVINSTGGAGGVTSFNTRTGAVTLTSGDVTTALGFTPGQGTVTSVTSADANATVATQTTTPVITIVSAPKLQTARTIAGVSFDGSANISIASTNLSNTANIVLDTNTITLTNKDLTSTTNLFPPSDFQATFIALGSSILFQTLGNQNIITTNAATSSLVKFSPIYINKSQLITGVKFYQGTQGNYTADSNNYIALYSYSGGNLTQVAITANNGNLWKGTSNTFVSTAFASTYQASPGLYFVAYLYHSSAQTTAPTLGAYTAPTNTGVVSYDFTNSALLYAQLNTQTSLTTPLAMSSLSPAAAVVWFGLY